jgi:hypothetical protein
MFISTPHLFNAACQVLAQYRHQHSDTPEPQDGSSQGQGGLLTTLLLLPTEQVVVCTQLEHQVGPVHDQQGDGSQAAEQQNLHRHEQ